MSLPMTWDVFLMGGKWHHGQTLESLTQHTCEQMAEEGRKEKTGYLKVF